MTVISSSAPQTAALNGNPLTLSDQLESLKKSCSTWQKRTLKNSNDRLYGILDECLELIGTLRDSKPLRKQLNAFLAQRGCAVKSNTPVERKVVSYVFGADCNQIDSYTRVLKSAKVLKPEGLTMVDWLNSEGGIDGVRRKNKSGKSAAEIAKLYAQTAEDALAVADPIGERFDAVDALLPQDCGDYELSVGVIRIDKDGKAAIVYTSNKSNLVRTMLVQAGKDKADQAKLEQEAKERQSVQSAQDALIRDLTDDLDLAA